MPTIANCLSTLGVSIETLAACPGLHEEWAILKKSYFKSALANHPDKGGDADKFRTIQSAFEALRTLFDGNFVSCFASSASKAVDAQSAAFDSSSTPSWEFYADAAEEPVPIYRVERAKSGRSKCAAKGAAKTCAADACIPKVTKQYPRRHLSPSLSSSLSLTSSHLLSPPPAALLFRCPFLLCSPPKDHLRVGWLNAETGSYGNWVRIECWRVPSKVTRPPSLFSRPHTCIPSCLACLSLSPRTRPLLHQRCGSGCPTPRRAMTRASSRRRSSR